MPFTMPASAAMRRCNTGTIQPLPSAEHRREERYAVDQSVLVFPPGMSPSARPALIRDISTRGMQLLVEEPFPSGPFYPHPVEQP